MTATEKIQIHVELNEAYATLLGICLKLDLKTYYKKLESGRAFMSFMSIMVDYDDPRKESKKENQRSTAEKRS